MPRTRKLVGSLAAGALVASLLAAPLPAAAEPTGHAAPPEAGEIQQVTLVTGDRVTITSPGVVSVQPAAGRNSVAFLSQLVDGHQLVIPSDARALLADGTLDQRLFDVTLLAEYGYDQRRADLPLIVSHDAGAAPAARTTTSAAPGATITHRLSSIDAVAVRVDGAELPEFWRSLPDHPGISVALDGLRQPALDQSVHQVGAPAAWAAGLDGTGVTVAVLDTGVDTSHPDLADRVAVVENFTDEADGDLVGHGTHVASTVAGSGAASDGRFRGVAPGATLLAGKVCHVNGCPDSAIMAGMQWAAEQGADVVNLSLGGPDEPGTDQTEALVDSLTDQFGTLFVIAAGNDAADHTINSPASADSALAVGAVDRQDQLAWFSSRGPRRDGALKPDLAAPGTGIVAAVPGGGYAASDGTSMATPHVSAAAAILVQQHPDWSPAQLTAALLGSAEPNPQTPVTGQGAGRLDLARAITQTVTTSPASLSFARQVWPHDDLQTLPVTYRNDGEADLTLTLALATIGPDGQPAPDGLFRTGEVVTVPAGGTAGTTVTVDPREHDLTGYFGGHLVATAPDGSPVVSTAFGVHLEVESYDLTMVHTDAAGNPTSDYDTLLVGPLDELESTRFTGDPTETLRMPAGRYFVVSWQVIETPTGGERWTMLVHPQLALSGDTTLELDSRLARPVSVTVPGRPVELVYTGAYAQYFSGRWTLAANTFTFDRSGLYTAQLGPDDPVDELTTSVTGAWAVPGPDGRLESTEEMYHLAEFVDGGVPTGLDRTLHRRDLAQVRSDHAIQTADGELFKGDGAIRLDPFVGAITPFMPLDGPSSRTDYYTTGGDPVWQSQLSESIPIDEEHSDPVILLNAEPTTYRPGPQPRQRWNYGVFGPGLTTEFAGVQREGDEMFITPELYGDSAGHQGVVFGSGRITVYKDGELFAERFWLPGLSAFVAVPPEEAEYRVEVAAQRFGAATLSTQTDLAWTLRSGHADGEVRAPTPVVRFHPPVDGRNSARSGLPFLVPVSVESPAGAVDLAELTVDVSYDDGQSWQPAPTLPLVRGRLLLLWHPPGAGFVSLRAQATDRAGNTVEQTVLRAYQLR